MNKDCKCIDLIEYPVVFKNGITHIRVECVDCKKFIKWKQQDPSTSKLWFGKHKGKMLCEVPTEYLEWVKKNVDNKKLLNKINIYLESNPRT